ncbi:hypothetical protein Sjap_011865 [Stephania japonica]|uniref:DUF4220 domain-containing protein n=1 Tax=Stephania japonica TaxID=461633 RepID=A0AAP0P5D7_9MAGN
MHEQPQVPWLKFKSPRESLGIVHFRINRRMVELFPEWMVNIWNKWEIRVLVLFSLLVQIILSFFGNKRKHITSEWIRVTIWLAYLSADWFSTVSLGVLSSQVGESATKGPDDDTRSQILALWGPFLLVHLGGPDSISAYALEDNELWLRNLFGFCVQTWIVVYVLLKSWRNNWLSFLNIPMLIVGITKHGGRAWVQRSASREHMRVSMPTSSNSSPNIIKLIEAQPFVLSNDTVLNSVENVLEAPYSWSHSDNARKLLDSLYFFSKFKYLFVDINLTLQDWHNTRSFFLSHNWDEAFQVIENELSFMYDILYTKAPMIYSPQGCILQLVSVSCTISALVVSIVYQNHMHQNVDTLITYVVLAVAIVLEVYNIVLQLYSDWTISWLIKHQDYRVCGALRSHAIHFMRLRDSHRWSNTMGQFNIVSFCLKERPIVLPTVQKLLHIDKVLEKHWYKTNIQVRNELKEFIFQQLAEHSKSAEDFKALRLFTNSRGLNALEKTNLSGLSWSVEGEFEQSILIWHIATELCYTLDLDKYPEASIKLECFCSGKSISDYMIYLLVVSPNMLSSSTGQNRFEATCSEAVKFFEKLKEMEPGLDKKQLCSKLVEAYTISASAASKNRGETFRHVLFEACQLVGILLQGGLRMERRWTLICEVWLEMLCYAAQECRGNDHAQQLRQGGELLTHVWLLMTHLGISKHFEVPPVLIK